MGHRLLLPVLIGLVLMLVNPFVPVPPARQVVRIAYSSRADLDTLASRLDIWEVHPDQNWLLALVDPAEANRLTHAGFAVQIDLERTARLAAPIPVNPAQTNGIPRFACYRTVNETYAAMQALASAHPNLAVWKSFGQSWDKKNLGGANGHELMVLVLSSKKQPFPKPRLFVMAAIHARELVTAETATRLAEVLLAGYGIDPEITALLDYNEIHIVPQSNPDGRTKVELNLNTSWRKNTNPGTLACGPVGYGVDLNRNSSFGWNGPGASTYPCSDIYMGTSAASEPETQALEAYMRSIFPDQRGPLISDAAPITTTGAMISLHSYSGLVLWPWGDTNNPAPNAPQLQMLGQKLAYYNHYTPQQANNLYFTSGTTDEFAYGDLGIAAYTFEMGRADFYETCADFENTIYPDNLKALMFAFKSARRPYQTPFGPQVVLLNTTTGPLQAALNVSGQADSTRYTATSYRPVNAVRASIDAPAWVSGTQVTSLPAADGTFDQPIEDFTGQIPVAGLSAGKHLLFVEAQDKSGNWGAPGAAFFIVPATQLFFPTAMH
jgi:murein tripeptide amidase MpaA